MERPFKTDTIEEARHKSEGLPVIENKAAPLLEKEFGMDFGGSYPRVFSLHGERSNKNIIRIFPPLPSLFLSTGNLCFLHTEQLYNYKLDTIFKKNNENKILTCIDFHENTHGYQRRINPDLMDGQKTLLELVNKSKKAKISPDNNQPEVNKSLGKWILTEGMAEWIGINAALNFPDTEKERARKRKAFWFTNNSEAEIPPAPSKKLLDMTTEGVKILHKAVNLAIVQKDDESIRLALRYIILPKYGSYFDITQTGFSYIHLKIQEEKASGTAIGKTLKNLCLNPVGADEILEYINTRYQDRV